MFSMIMARKGYCLAIFLRAIMCVQRKKVLLACVSLIFGAFIHYLMSSPSSVVNVQQRLDSSIEKLLQSGAQHLETDLDVPFHPMHITAGALARNGCVCEGDTHSINVPNLLFPQVSAQELQFAFEASKREGVKQRRLVEYSKFQKRSQSAANLLIVAEANSPLQYPTQGLEVRPMKSILIPGLALKDTSRSLYSVSLTASMGRFAVVTMVDEVRMSEGEMHMNLSSSLQSALNRQLQFITYTNTIFHPDATDIVHFDTDGFQAAFTIKIHHKVPPKLYDPGPEYNISALVTIATKTFLRYDKLQDLIDSVRQFYPTVTIIIADDSEQPKPVTGPYIEHYIMPFRKGWFAGRNLAISQVTTKYVLWVDDDFIFSSNTRLEKMVEVLERTTLDLVGGAVREVTGYTATYRHTISTDEGGEEGDCLHIRRGFYHIIEGFPNCVVTDAVINFFMARTDKLRQVGFDPRLARAAHLEFFIDGLGSLHVGSCDDVIVNHASKIKAMLPWGQSKTDEAYSKFRYQAASNIQNTLFYFKNHFKCKTSNG
ncbi:beta-1,4 N-acetylgalactosaminyltransferase 1a [Colossoma macropomum]|uniref:beta-1,4 N-acetylgalactosaminyltransferase 1a n=1 Tax=Colossoma macropomum TaxID=42526 RepID=UPI0018640559|nr:beta-1,4 N-acetylgalactosaminyltransferase 1a [Colossoma macropomum]